MKKINRFYVGAKNIAQAIQHGHNDDWTHATLTGAIKHAQTIIEDEDLDGAAVIVQIIRVVKRQKSPLVVEVVRK